MSEILPRLYYLSDNEPKLLPEWAYFFMRLGHQLVDIPCDKHRFVTGLAIPTRAFSSSLIGAGIVFAKAGTENYVDEVRLQYIRNLEPGTSVHVRKSNGKFKGIVERFEENNGQTYIVIRITKSTSTTGSLKSILPLALYASKITVAHNDISLSGKQSGRRMEAPSKFVQICLGKELAEEYIHSSSFEALIIGKKSVIQHEICDTPFICRDSSKSADVKGYLQEILRVRQFSGTNKSYRIECISSLNEALKKEIGRREPPIVIFDGAVAYIKHGHKWTTSHQIVLLDRTERQFSDATELLNQNYAYRSIDKFKFPIKIPSGIEMMMYKE